MKRRISEAVRKQVMSEYYQERARRAGSVRSAKKTAAARQAALLTGRCLHKIKRDYPGLAGDIDAYMMACEQDKVLKRKALLEKMKKVAKPA
jgi:hypothetical protein